MTSKAFLRWNFYQVKYLSWNQWSGRTLALIIRNRRHSYLHFPKARKSRNNNVSTLLIRTRAFHQIQVTIFPTTRSTLSRFTGGRDPPLNNLLSKGKNWSARFWWNTRSSPSWTRWRDVWPSFVICRWLGPSKKSSTTRRSSHRSRKSVGAQSKWGRHLCSRQPRESSKKVRYK